MLPFLPGDWFNHSQIIIIVVITVFEFHPGSGKPFEVFQDDDVAHLGEVHVFSDIDMSAGLRVLAREGALAEA